MQFGVLGEIQAHRSSSPVDIGHFRQRSVLAAVLVDANSPVTVVQLVSRVWGDLPPRSARSTLLTYITRLRQALAGPEGVRVERRRDGYLLTITPDAVDLLRFQQLLAQARASEDDGRAAKLFGQALALWRGDPLAGLDTPWGASVRGTLSGQRLGAQLDLADIKLRRQQHTELVPDLTDLSGAHPLDERLSGQLILALYRSGRQADALTEYDRIRKLLAEDLGVDPSTALRQLHQQVLTSDADIGPAVHTGRARSSSSVPRQLPAAPGSFVGRADLLTALDRGNAKPSAPVVISAIGGSGKTWLALHWASRNLDSFPDGQLYVNLRGFDPAADPMPVATAMRGFLDALGVDPASIPADPDALGALYRCTVGGKRILLVLDNAADSRQVVPLLPGTASCTVVITSRKRLTGLVTSHGAQSIALDMLPDDEARELLARHLGTARMAAEAETVSELVRLCAGLPFALGVVAARSATQPDLPLSLLVADLGDQADRLDGFDTGEPDLNLRAVFSWSLQSLDPEAVALFGLLGLAPGPDIGLPGAATLAGKSATTTRSLLRTLENSNLVARTADQRYRMHDLVRLYAAEHAETVLPRAALTEALRRVIDFYLQTVEIGAQVVHPGLKLFQPSAPLDGCVPEQRVTPDETLRWLDTEYACITAATELAAARGWDDLV